MSNHDITTIVILGRGSVGEALGAAWRRAGFKVLFGLRSPRLADEVALKGAASCGDAIVLAIPYAAAQPALSEAGIAPGQLVIDCTNPLIMTADGLALALGFSTSGGEEIARFVPHAHVVKTLNQTGAENLGHADRFPEPAAMFLAGDDEASLAAAAQLVASIGFLPINAGPLRNARLLEPLAMLWIDQAFKRGAGRDFAFARMLRSDGKTP